MSKTCLASVSKQELGNEPANRSLERRHWAVRNYATNLQIPRPLSSPSLLRPLTPTVAQHPSKADYIMNTLELLSLYTCSLESSLYTYVEGEPTPCLPKVRVVVPLQTPEENELAEYLDYGHPSAIDNLIQKGLFPKLLLPYLKQGPLALQAVLSLPRDDLLGIGYLIANDTDTCKIWNVRMACSIHSLQPR